MHIKFKITYEGGGSIESHDEVYNQVKDHCDALAPFNHRKWHKYELITDEGTFIRINFQTGTFNINGQVIHPATGDGIPLTNRGEKQDFRDVQKSWAFLSDLNYFPIVGRRQLKGDWGEKVIYFAGWKFKYGGKTIQKIAYIYPDGQIVLT